MTGQRTIAETGRITVLDLPAMEAVAAVHRASGVLRSRAERQVLGPHRLTWTTWVVLQIVSVWKEIETRHVASEAGISKSTLTGVVATLDRRGLIRRRVHPGDARRVLLTPTEAGAELVEHLLPRINAEETAMLSGIPRESLGAFTSTLHALTEHVAPQDGSGPEPRDVGSPRDSGHAVSAGAVDLGDLVPGAAGDAEPDVVLDLDAAIAQDPSGPAPRTGDPEVTAVTGARTASHAPGHEADGEAIPLGRPVAAQAAAKDRLDKPYQ